MVTGIVGAVRIFAVYVLLLAVGLACAIVFGRQEMLVHVNHRIDAELNERVADLQGVAAAGVDPATGRRLTGVADLLRAGIAQSAPEQNATVIALLDGRPYARLAGTVPYRIDTDPELVARWAQTSPKQLRQRIDSGRSPALRGHSGDRRRATRIAESSSPPSSPVGNEPSSATSPECWSARRASY